MRVAGADHRVDPRRLILAQALGHRLGRADERGAGAGAHEADAGPEVRADLEPVAAAAMQGEHPLLADAVALLVEPLGRLGDRCVVEPGDQPVGGGPGFLVGLADDEVEADAEGDVAPAPRRRGPDLGDLLGDLCRGLAPGEVFVGPPGGEFDAGIRGSAEIERRARSLHRGIAERRPDGADMRAVQRCRTAGQQVLEDREEFLRMVVALVMRQEEAVARQLGRVATDDDVKEQPPIRHAVEGRGEAGVIGGRGHARPDRHEEFQLLGHRRERGGGHEGFLAGGSGRQQHALVAEPVHRHRDLAQIAVVGRAVEVGRAEIAAVAGGRDEPEEIDGPGHDGGLLSLPSAAR